MAKKNDPERLEAEVQELMDQYAAQEETPETAQSQEDISEEEQTVSEQDTPDPTDTVEAQTEEEPVKEESRGDDSEARAALAKAERAMKGAQAKMTKATTEAADLRRQNAELIKSITELKSQLVEKERDDGKLDQIREDYPDLAGPLLDELQRTQAEVQKAKEALAGQEQQRMAEIQEQSAQAHFERIQMAHPDVEEITSTADWSEWLDVQDAQTQAWIESGSSNDVNTVLSRFKEDLGLQPQIKPQETVLQKAKKVAEPKLPKARKQNPNRESRTWSVEEISRMSNSDFMKHQGEILEAMKGGQIRQH